MNIITTKPVILAFTGFYLPGYRGGGPIRSIANMAARLSSDFEFLIVTRDRDLDDPCPYPGVNVNVWNQVGCAKVFYMSPSARTLQGVKRLLRETRYDVLYLNSFFDPTFAVFPLLARQMSRQVDAPTVLAPRGEFSEGAFGLKHWKKSPFARLARWTGLLDGLTWHASTEFEAADIRRVLGREAVSAIRGRVVVAPDLVTANSDEISHSYGKDSERESGSRQLSVCFLSRLSPMKNLDFALRVLGLVSAPVQFTIYGPQEDKAYWAMCQALIAQLPKHIKVTYAGAVPHADVHATLEKHDLFFLPTRGENFGHVFLEAWSAGLPVLVSDQTPWRNLVQQHLGWDVPLDAPESFVLALEAAAAFDMMKWVDMRQSCRQFASEQAVNAEALELNRRLFSDALGASAAKLFEQSQTNE